MHGRDLRARGVTSVNEHVNLQGTPQDIAVRLRGILRARHPQMRENIVWHAAVSSPGSAPAASTEASRRGRGRRSSRARGARRGQASSEAWRRGCGAP